MECDLILHQDGRTYKCIRTSGHDGPCIPQILVEHNDHHEMHEAYE